MHVIQLVPELNQGGVERGVVELSRELVRRGHASSVISNGGRLCPELEADGARHYTLDVRNKNLLTVPKRVHALKRLLTHLRPQADILHARSRVPAWLTLWANRSLRIPFVTTVHGFNSVSPYSAVMTRGDRVIVGSSAIREFVQTHYRVPPDRLRDVPRGVDMAAFDPALVDVEAVAERRRAWGLEGRRVVTMVGRVTELKGHNTFLRALADVQRQVPGIKGLIVGGAASNKMTYLKSLQTLAQEMAVDVTFAGAQRDMLTVYALSDLLVSAAHSTPESFGRTAAEALAMDTPVVASAHGGSLDIIRDGVNGLFFPPGDVACLAVQIVKAIDTPFREMRSHIKNNFSLECMVEKELAVYRELAG